MRSVAGLSKPVKLALAMIVLILVVSVGGLLYLEDNPEQAPHRDFGSLSSQAGTAPESQSLSSSNASRGEDDWMIRAETATRWPIPPNLRLPGGPVDAALADSPEDWLLRLPASQQPAAQAFLERNAAAYAFRSKAEQAWLIENGFPTLEEAAFFAGMDRASTCMASADQLKLSIAQGSERRCSNPKLAALSADGYVQKVAEINELIARGGGADVIVVGGVASISQRSVEALMFGAEAESLLQRSSVGAYRFYRLADIEKDMSALSPSSQSGADRAAATLALAYVCEGDSRVDRVSNPELWANPSTAGVSVAIWRLGTDLRRADGTAVCGFSSKGFPSRS